MLKAQQLREHLKNRVGFLHGNPDRLVTFIEDSGILPNYASLNFEYQYTLTVGIMDYVGNPDIPTLAIIEFMRDYQRDVMQNAELARDAIKLNAEIIDHERYDLSYKVTLRETVQARLNDGVCATDADCYSVRHLPAPFDVNLVDARFVEVLDEVGNEVWSDEALALLNQQAGKS